MRSAWTCDTWKRPTQVEAEVGRYCEVLGRDGGYILGPAHLFQPDVPPENILAVYRGTNT